MFVSQIVKAGSDLVLCVANLLNCYKLHYTYDPDNDYSDDTPYCYSLLSPVDRKLYDEIYQTLNPLTIPEHRTWTRSNVTEEQAEHLHRIVDGINIDYDEEFYFHNREITYENGVFTVHSEMMVDSVPPEQLIPENLKAYQNICEKADRIIEAMPKTLTRYGKYIYLAKAVCDMTEYVNYLEGGQEPNYYWGRIRGAFEDGKTFCQGYGDAYEFLCHCAGLYCLCINGNGHKWSGIRLNNELYHMDTTWMDAGEGDYYKAYSHPFTSDEEGHEPHMKDFHVWSHLYPEWGRHGAEYRLDCLGKRADRTCYQIIFSEQPSRCSFCFILPKSTYSPHKSNAFRPKNPHYFHADYELSSSCFHIREYNYTCKQEADSRKTNGFHRKDGFIC